MASSAAVTIASGVFTVDPYARQGNGSPEGVETAPVGAVYKRLDGAAGTAFYVKESGTGNTGWIAQATGSTRVLLAGDTMTGDLTISRAALGAYLNLSNNLGTTQIGYDASGNALWSTASPAFLDSGVATWRDASNSYRQRFVMGAGATTDSAWNRFIGRLTAGVATDLGSVFGVVGTAVTRVAQTIRLFAAQTALALRIEDSAGSLLMSVDAAGGVACTSLAVGQAIIEGATTPTAVKDTLVWSTVHAALVRHDGTQWQYAAGPGQWGAYDDLMLNAASNGGIASAAIASGTLVSVGQTARHPGQFTWQSSTTANSGRSAIGTANQQPGAGLRGRFVFQTPATLTGTTSARFGWLSATTSAVVALVSGINLDITGATATLKTTSASTTTTSASATLAVSTWYTCHLIQTSATAVRMIIVADSGTVALDVTNSANVPSAVNLSAAALATNSGVTATALFTVDSIGFGWAL